MGKRKHIVNLVFTVLLLGMFALAAIFVAVLGAQVYQGSAAKMESNFDTRTSLMYIAEKFRRSVSSDFDVRQFGDGDALVISEKYEDDNNYETWIYTSDGKLYEATVVSGTEVTVGLGQTIMDMKSLSFEVSGNTVKITTVTGAGEQESLTLAGRS